jgi:hypothetical protein
MDNMSLEPRWRTGLGMILIVLLIILWCVLVVWGADLVAGTPWPVQAAYYLIAGIVWILPMKPLIRWMHRGRPQV